MAGLGLLAHRDFAVVRAVQVMQATLVVLQANELKHFSAFRCQSRRLALARKRFGS